MVSNGSSLAPGSTQSRSILLHLKTALLSEDVADVEAHS